MRKKQHGQSGIFMLVMAAVVAIIVVSIVPFFNATSSTMTLQSAIQILAQNNYVAWAIAGLTPGQVPYVNGLSTLSSNGGLTYDSATNTLTSTNSIATTANITTLNAPTGRGATYIVAGNDASTTVKAQADALSDGTADDVQINAGISALPAGRTSYATVKLIGSFSTTNTINLASYTILDLSEAKITAGANVDVITIPNTVSNVKIIKGLIDGNKGAGYTKYGITLSGNTSSETPFYVTIDGTEIQNAGDMGIQAMRANYVWINNSKVHDCTNRGIFFNGGGYVWLKDNQTYRNGTVGGYGTYFGSNLGAGKSWHNVYVDGLQTWDNVGNGLVLTDNDNTLSPTGFEISRITSTNNTASNIVLQYINSGIVSDIITSLSGSHGIEYESTSNVTSTSIHSFDNAGADVLVAKNGGILSQHLVFNGIDAHGNGVASGDGVTISNTTYSTFANINSYNHTTADYGINEFSGGDYNTYIGNNLNNNTVNFAHTGTHDIVRSNIGYVTENSGTFSITANLWGVSVSHGLSTNATSVMLTLTSNTTSTVYVLAPITTTTFSANLSALQGSTVTGYWRAVIGAGN